MFSLLNRLAGNNNNSAAATPTPQVGAPAKLQVKISEEATKELKQILDKKVYNIIIDNRGVVLY